MDTNMEKDCAVLEEFFQHIVLDMKNSIPVWEDFNMKAGRMHAALRTTAACTSAFLESFQKLADMALGTRGSTREIGSALTRLCLRHRSIDAKLKTFASAISELMVAPVQERIDDWKKTVVSLDREHSRENKRVHQELRRAAAEVARLQKKARKGKAETNEQLEVAVREANERLAALHHVERQSVRSALIEQRGRLCLFVCGLKPVMDEELAIVTELAHIQEIVHSLCLLSSDPDSLPECTEHLIDDMLSDGQTRHQLKQTHSSPGSGSSRLSSVDTVAVSSAVNLSPTHVPYQRSQSMPSPASTSSSTPVMQGPMLAVDATDHMLQQQQQCIADTEHTTEVTVETDWPEVESANTSQSFPPIPSTVDQRPHTISSAYERTAHARPSLSADTFTPLTSGGPTSRSRPPSIHGGLPSTGPPSSASPYAVPCIVPKHRRDMSAGGAKVADIYARPALIGSRSNSIRAVPVATPTVPDFVGPLSPQPATSASSESAVPTTYPVGGYVNMNQLAHMALQHQGLCPTDKKHDHDDLGHEQSPAGGYRPDQWEDFDPRGQRSYPPPIDNAGIDLGMLRARLDTACRLHQLPINGYCTLPRRPAARRCVSSGSSQQWLSLTTADIASVYTSKMPQAGQPQYAESAVSHGAQYLRGMSAPGDGRVIHADDYQYYGYNREDCRGVPQLYSHAGDDHRGIPQHYSHAGEDCRGVQQHYSQGREDHRGVPQHYTHGREDHHGVPQHYSHGREDHHGVPQHYSHAGEDCRGVPHQGREDRRGVPHHCGHTLVHDHESPVL